MGNDDLIMATIFAVFAAFALWMLYEGVFPKTHLRDARHHRIWRSTALWLVFQAAIVIYAFYLYQEHTDRTATAGSAILVGAAVAGYFTFMLSKIADWLRQLSRRWRQPQRQR